MNENRCHIENIKGLENHKGILREHVIGREMMIIIFIQENKIKNMDCPKVRKNGGKLVGVGKIVTPKKLLGKIVVTWKTFC